MTTETLPIWPVGLPVGLANGYGYQRDDTRTISNPAIGPPRIRLQSQSGKTQFTIPFELTNEQLAEFEAFYEQVLISGSLHFLMPLRTGTGMHESEAFILKRGKVTKPNRKWRIQLTIITYERA